MRSISIAVGLSLLHTVLAQRSNCYGGYCCSGSIVGGCNGNDISNFICCVGDTNRGQNVCVGDGVLTCSAGIATPLASATVTLAVASFPPSSSTITMLETTSPTSPTAEISQTESSTPSSDMTTPTAMSSPSMTSPSVMTTSSSKSAPATSPTRNAAVNAFGAMPGQMAFKMVAAAINAF
ncbi:uncharacterized protein K489DRAFT_383250 [Dissoconium aciculare CBS 342.82]|uniref:Uncharacterized protein n=1 Tax=Dissoconium aciculare CBS 342.82 TaxID=1314786 RepID=A0A6J3LXG3_9PEZI|nr:uncharacterized protein K489DRAFT_383250 [Dissoconium aciculare CBS 342.82]KAF1820441.1 hypothetical protein K489DRAFT_383250 [Dissoconium aciculare CBS 342.82]